MSFTIVNLPSTTSFVSIDTRTGPNKIIMLPAASTVTGRLFTIKDQYGGASLSTYTLSTVGMDKIDGRNWMYTFSNAFGAISFLSDGRVGWRVVGLYDGTSTAFPPPFMGLSGTVNNFTTDNSTYTFPANVTKVRVFLWGGGAGADNGGSGCGGSGAHVAGDILKGSMTTLTIYTNRGGGSKGPGAGVNGAGFAAIYNSTNGYLVIAGAGGGGGGWRGGGGGYFNGYQGGSSSQVGTVTTARNYSHGGGGSQTQGGDGGWGNSSGTYVSGSPGGYLYGGNAAGSAHGSGGGGGYYGGGGANGDTQGGLYSGNGAGGGGSSYVNTSFVTNYTGEEGKKGSTASVTPGGSTSPFYLSGYGVGGYGTGGGAALVVIVPYS